MGVDREALLTQYRKVRGASIAMCKPLQPEEFRIQPAEDVSPPWWNLGHTSWFFVRNIIQPFGGNTLPEDEVFDYVLNSYYVSLGPRLNRFKRGLITRPTTEKIFRYREVVDERVEKLIQEVEEDGLEKFDFLLTLGMHHEQQHQELFYTEIKYILAETPVRLREPYQECRPQPGEGGGAGASELVPFQGGLFEFGNIEGGWCWDNELALHKYHLEDFALGNRLVTNAEYLEFIEDGGYQKTLLWLSNGWDRAQEERWQAPLYWEKIDGEWWMWTLGGMVKVNAHEPVCHVSFYEADAFARWKSQAYQEWKGGRLPTEREWEHGARVTKLNTSDSNLLGTGRLHPSIASGQATLVQMVGDVWEWTASYYEPYPGFKPFSGDLEEYNGKFMDNQRVLRGGSCVTEEDHMRISYRNFWSPVTRFQFSGIRLAKDL